MAEIPEDYLADAITEAFGERCPDFAEGCPCCDAWAQYDAVQLDLAELRAWREVSPRPSPEAIVAAQRSQNEFHRRAMDILGDQRVGVTITATEIFRPLKDAMDHADRAAEMEALSPGYSERRAALKR